MDEAHAQVAKDSKAGIAMNLLSYIVINDWPRLLIGCLIFLLFACIAWKIVQKMELPPFWMNILSIVALIILLMILLDFFYGFGGSRVIVR